MRTVRSWASGDRLWEVFAQGCPFPGAKSLRGRSGTSRAGSRCWSPGCADDGWWGARLIPAREELDDDHVAAAARAQRSGIWRVDRCVVPGRWCDSKQSAGVLEMGLAGGSCEQTVVADAVEPARQDVEEEAADELVGRERHDLLPLGADSTVILVAEGDAATRSLVNGSDFGDNLMAALPDRRARLRVRQTAAWHRPPSASYGPGRDGAGTRAGR